MKCAVLIVEDDLRFREAFVHAISLASDMTLVGSAAASSPWGICPLMTDIEECS